MGKVIGGCLLALLIAGCAPPPDRLPCNPVFNRGDAVRFRAMPETRFVVRYMNMRDCSATLSAPDLTNAEIGTDLLELVPR